MKKHGSVYDYSLVEYVNNITKIKILCPIHGIFEQTPSVHYVSGCPKCFKIQLKDFIEKSSTLHDNYYDYSLIDFIKNNKQKVKIICPRHGIFEQRIDGHLTGKGCVKCGFDKLIIGADRFIENSKMKHGDIYDYSKVKETYVNQRSIVEIKCKKHGFFKQIAYNHSHGNGCPTCKHDSKGQKAIRKYLIEKNIKFKEQKSFNECKYRKCLYFDFYLPSYNACIEYDGEQHFIPVKKFGGEKLLKENKLRDSIKNNFCENNKINILRIRFNENIIEKLNNYFSTKLL